MQPIENKYFLMCPNDLRKKISKKTGAVVIVHIGGRITPYIEEIKTICKKYNVPLIEDAAQAVGSKFKKINAGNFGDAGAMSFYTTKVMTTGEGGMITTNDDALGEKLQILRNHGASISEEERHHGAKPYILPDFNVLGYNYRMTDLQGAIGVVQLKKLDQFIDERAQWADYYKRELASIPWLSLPSFSEDYKHGWQSFVLIIDQEKAPCSRNEIMERLQEKGISTRPGTHAVHMLGFYRVKYTIQPQDYPGAQIANDQSISIPLHNKMVKEDFEYIVNVIKNIS